MINRAAKQKPFPPPTQHKKGLNGRRLFLIHPAAPGFQAVSDGPREAFRLLLSVSRTWVFSFLSRTAARVPVRRYPALAVEDWDISGTTLPSLDSTWVEIWNTNKKQPWYDSYSDFLKTTLLRTATAEINTLALRMMSQGKYALAFFVSFSFGRRMTTDIFIYRRESAYFIWRLQEIIQASSNSLLRTFRKKMSKLKILLPFTGRVLPKTSTRKKAGGDEDTKKSNSFSWRGIS